MRQIKKYWKTPLYSLVVLILCGFTIALIRSYYNFHFNIVISLFTYLFLTYWLRSKAISSKEKMVHTFLILTPFIAISILALFRPIINYAPGLIFAPVLGVFFGYLLEKTTNKLLRVAIVIMPLIIGVWVYVGFADAWQDFIIYGTFKNGSTFKECPQFTFIDDTIALSNVDFKGKTSIFYIWNTTCPYCHRDMPVLKEKLTKWSNYENIDFYSLNIPIDRDTKGTALSYLSKYNVKVKNLTGPKNDEMYKIFGAFGYPLTIIINSEGNIIYWGSINKIDKTLKNVTNI